LAQVDRRGHMMKKQMHAKTGFWSWLLGHGWSNAGSGG
jgi:hypothetical protein